MTDLWTGPFGDAYTARNRTVGVDARQAIWETLLPRGCESVLEVGANSGANLQAIANFSDAEIYACEPNDVARNELMERDLAPDENIRADRADKLSFPNEVADLAFTSGVLIHIPSDKLLASMREIHRCAARYIICAEYFAPAPTEEMVPYRGHRDALWRRDYGSIWLDNFDDLHCISCMFAWQRMTGLDNLTFWTFAKGPRHH